MFLNIVLKIIVVAILFAMGVIQGGVGFVLAMPIAVSLLIGQVGRLAMDAGLLWSTIIFFIFWLISGPVVTWALASLMGIDFSSTFALVIVGAILGTSVSFKVS